MEMNRRRFLGVVGTVGMRLGGLGSAPPGAAPTGAPDKAVERPPEADAARDRLRSGCQAWGYSEQSLQFYRRYGVRHIMATPPDREDGTWAVEDLLKVRRKVEAHGMRVDMADLGVSLENVLLGRSPERDRDIEVILDKIATAAEAGIPALHYHLMWGIYRGPTETYRTNLRAPGRGGSTYDTWVLEDALKLPNAPTQRRGPKAEVMWERLSYFLERVMPVAAEHKVKMAFHPPDPPWPPGFWGVDRVPATIEQLDRYLGIAENLYHGLLFCQGTICEMLDDPAGEINDVIHHFGRKGKIFAIHFRNIRGRRGNFQEVFPDEGDVDMFSALRAYRDAGCACMVMPDHVPENKREAYVFAYGYNRALIQAVYAQAQG